MSAPAGVEPIRNYIEGAWHESAAAERVPVTNPATGDALGYTPLSSAREVGEAVHAAARAFPSWRRTPVTDRIQFLFKLKVLLEEHFEDISRTITLECGKTLQESRGEMRRAVENVEVACGTPILIQGYNSEDIAVGIDETMIRQPLGVCAIIAPFNFPGMIPFWFLPYALACGNTVVIKPSRACAADHAESDGAVRCASSCRMASSTWSTAAATSSMPCWTIRRFVRSVSSARARSRNTSNARAAAAGKRAQCQGGAKNPVVILPDADLAGASDVVADSAFGCAGQRCLATSLAITVGEARRPFRDAMREKARARVTGDGLEAGVQMGPVISPESRSRIVISSRERSAKAHSRWWTGAMPGLEAAGISSSRRSLKGCRTPATSPQRRYSVLSCRCIMSTTIDAAISLVNSGTYGNQACLFTSSGASARKFRHEAEVGNIGINIAVAAPMAFFPFSGARESFFGDLHGQAAMPSNSSPRKKCRRTVAQPLGSKVLAPGAWTSCRADNESSHRNCETPSPRAAARCEPRLFSAAGHPEAAGHQRLRHPAADAGAMPRRRGQEPACRRRVLGDDSARGAVLRRLHRYRCRRSDAARAGSVRAQQGPRGGGAGLDLCRAGLLRSLRPAELAILPEHSERPSRAVLPGIHLATGRWARASRVAQGFAIAGRRLRASTPTAVAATANCRKGRSGKR